jgi:hypothetical protein
MNAPGPGQRLRDRTLRDDGNTIRFRNEIPVANEIPLSVDAPAEGETGSTGWNVKEAMVSLGVDVNGQVSLWAVKGQAGAKALLDITLRRS